MIRGNNLLDRLRRRLTRPHKLTAQSTISNKPPKRSPLARNGDIKMLIQRQSEIEARLDKLEVEWQVWQREHGDNYD